MNVITTTLVTSPGEPPRYCRWTTVITEIQFDIAHKYVWLHIQINVFIYMKRICITLYFDWSEDLRLAGLYGIFWFLSGPQHS